MEILFRRTNIPLILLLILVFDGGFIPAVVAQTNSFTATAGVKIGTALSLTETASLHFGTMTRPTATVNVTVSTTSVRSASSSSGITLLAQAPTYHAAAYTVYGSKNSHYVITLPGNNIVKISNGNPAFDMFVNNFIPRTTSNGIGVWSGKLNHLGEDFFTVGATLYLSNGQANGIYSGTFNVTVAYD